jgi:hypothetical protein
VAEFTADDPMCQGMLWINLSRREISRRMGDMGTPASRLVVRKLLKKHGLGPAQYTQEKIDGHAPGLQCPV